MNKILAEKNGFEFQRWVENYDIKYLQEFITEEASGKYKIDMFSTSSMYYLWYPTYEKYIEISTSLDMGIKSNITKLITTLDVLITEGKI